MSWYYQCLFFCLFVFAVGFLLLFFLNNFDFGAYCMPLEKVDRFLLCFLVIVLVCCCCFVCFCWFVGFLCVLFLLLLFLFVVFCCCFYCLFSFVFCFFCWKIIHNIGVAGERRKLITMERGSVANLPSEMWKHGNPHKKMLQTRAVSVLSKVVDRKYHRPRVFLIIENSKKNIRSTLCCVY